MARVFTTLFRDLRALSVSNMEYFQRGTSSYDARFHQAFCLMHEHLDRGVQPAIEEIAPVLHKYDLSPDTQASGYRSLLKITHKCCVHLLQLSRYINVNKNSIFFRASHYSKELDGYVTVLGQLRACLYYVCKLIPYSPEGSLFADENSLNDPTAEHLMREAEALSQNCFYGRCLGFQFCESMQRPLRVVAVAMASFADGYQEKSNMMQLATSVFSSSKYILNPELRAEQIVHVTRTADVKFCKAFWSITESDVMQQTSTFVCPAVQVNEVFKLEPETFELPVADNDDETVVITPACAHTGYGPVSVRLISYERREGQEVQAKKNKRASTKLSPTVLPRSSSIVIHCHGGGFVAQSSRSHEVYLRQWAKDLDVPILSIDYSLAPEFPFPRALEEAFFVYAWALKNCHQLGWTGETVCLAGDSAGANLMLSVALRAGSYGIQVPDGIMAAYPVTLVRYTPSPSRVLSLMDPLLPVGIITRCLAAYAGISDELLAQTTNPDIDNFVIIDEDEVSEAAVAVDAAIQIKGDNQTKVASNGPKGTRTENSTSEDTGNVQGLKIQETDTTGEKVKVDIDSISSQSSSVLVGEDEVNLETDLQANILTNEGPDQSLNDGDYDIVNKEEVEINDDKESEVEAKENSNEDSGTHRRISESALTDQELSPAEVISDVKESGQTGHQPDRSNLNLDLKSDQDKDDQGIPRVQSNPELFAKGRKDTFTPMYSHSAHIQMSPIHLFRKLPIVKNPYMSPLLAPDEMLKALPPVHLVACHLDPLLDDSVMFAKRLRSLGKTVDLHLVEDLPHGFLNFSTASREAKLASDVCVQKIREVIQH